MNLKTWKTRLEKVRTEYDEAMASWRTEDKKLSQLAGLPDDVPEWDYRTKVFEVQDVSARKALIAHSIKLGELTLKEAYYEVELNEYRVEEAKTMADTWWKLPSFQTVLFCFAALGLERVKISPIVGAIAAAACGLMLGLSYRDVRMRQMREGVKEARTRLRQAKEWLVECRETKPRFSDGEAKTGLQRVA